MNPTVEKFLAEVKALKELREMCAGLRSSALKPEPESKEPGNGDR